MLTIPCHFRLRLVLCGFLLAMIAVTQLLLLRATQTRRPVMGFNLVGWSVTSSESPQPWIDAVHELDACGIRAVAFAPYRFVDSTSGSLSEASAHALAPPPTLEVLRSSIQEAKRLDMEVTLNPFLEIDNPINIAHEWRGRLDFRGPSLDRFFRGYRNYILGVAQLLEHCGGGRLYIGSELKALSLNPAAGKHWKSLINDVRVCCPQLVLSYAANYDNFEAVPFWRYLDEVGVDAYFPLADKPTAVPLQEPSRHDIIEAWHQHLHRLEKFSLDVQRPIVVSEWGVVPFNLTTTNPADSQPTMTSDVGEQLNAYVGTIEAITSPRPWLRGIFFWHWTMPGNRGSHFGVRPTSPLAREISRYALRQGRGARRSY